MLISEDSARVSVHAHDGEMPTISLDSGDEAAPRRGRAAMFSKASIRRAFVDKDAAMATSEARSEELLAFHEGRLSWRIYRTLCQIRFGYLSFLVLMVLLMFSFTLLMEIFFAIFLPSARTFSTEYVLRSVILLALLPVVLFFLSYLFEEASRFFFDAINKNDGGLPNFRLAIAVVIHYVRNRSTFKATAKPDHTALPHVPEQVMTEHRRSILLTPREDPYADVDDEEKEDDQEEPKPVVEEPAPATSEARSRWKRTGKAVLATNLMKKTHFEGPPIGLTTFLVVDFICPVLFELVTIVMFVLEMLDSWSPYTAFLSYVRNGFWLMFVYLIVWMGCHFWSSRNPHMRLLVSHYRRSRRHLKREVRSVAREKQAEQLWLLDVGFRFYHHVALYINPLAWIRRRPAAAASQTDELAQPPIANGTAVQSADATQVSVQISDEDKEMTSAQHKRIQNIRNARAWLREKNPWYRLSYNQQALILLLFCVATALISLWSFMLGWPLMGISLIKLSSVIQRRFPQIFGNTFRHFITTFVVFSLIFFSSTWIIGTFVKGGNFKLGMPTNTTLTAAKTPSERLATPESLTIEYPVCTIDYEGLTVLDLALIADAAYGSTPEIQQTALENRFNGTELKNFVVKARNNASEHQVWMELYFPTLNMTVVAIRGTASAADALEDLHYWFGITIMQSVNVFVPFLKQLPRDFVVSLLSMKSISSFMPPPVFEPVVEHTKAVKARVGDQLVITGHSLGGAMAAMIGAKVKAQAVSFSGPGLLYSRGRFDVEAQDVRDYVLTLKPQKDIVPQVDELGGMVQELRCREKSPMGCHGTDTHMCELYLSCGDSRQRNWAENKQCNRYQTLPVSTVTQG